MLSFPSQRSMGEIKTVMIVCACLFRLVEESDLEIAKQAFGESTVYLDLKEKYLNIKQRKTIINKGVTLSWCTFTVIFTDPSSMGDVAHVNDLDLLESPVSQWLEHPSACCRRSEIWFSFRTQKFFFAPCSWQAKMTSYLHEIQYNTIQCNAMQCNTSFNVEHTLNYMV